MYDPRSSRGILNDFDLSAFMVSAKDEVGHQEFRSVLTGNKAVIALELLDEPFKIIIRRGKGTTSRGRRWVAYASYQSAAD